MAMPSTNDRPVRRLKKRAPRLTERSSTSVGSALGAGAPTNAAGTVSLGSAGGVGGLEGSIWEAGTVQECQEQPQRDPHPVHEEHVEQVVRRKGRESREDTNHNRPLESPRRPAQRLRAGTEDDDPEDQVRQESDESGLGRDGEVVVVSVSECDRPLLEPVDVVGGVVVADANSEDGVVEEHL